MDWKVTYRAFHDGRFTEKTFQQQVLNVGGGGIAFIATTTIKPGTVVAMVLEATPFQSSIMALAKVAWCKPANENHRFGAEFLWIGWYEDTAQQAIAEYVNSVMLKR